MEVKFFKDPNRFKQYSGCIKMKLNWEKHTDQELCPQKQLDTFKVEDMA